MGSFPSKTISIQNQTTSLKPLPYSGANAIPYISNNLFVKINVFQSEKAAADFVRHYNEIHELADSPFICFPLQVTQKKQLVVSEYSRASYDLFECIKNKKTNVETYCFCVLFAIIDIHSKGFTHGDLKVDNIICFEKDNSAKLCDLDTVKSFFHTDKKKDTLFEKQSSYDLFCFAMILEKTDLLQDPFWNEVHHLFCFTNLRHLRTPYLQNIRAVDALRVATQFKKKMNTRDDLDIYCDCKFRKDIVKDCIICTVNV